VPRNPYLEVPNPSDEADGAIDPIHIFALGCCDHNEVTTVYVNYVLLPYVKEQPRRGSILTLIN
jgi:hypothetical protein